MFKWTGTFPEAGNEEDCGGHDEVYAEADFGFKKD